MSEATATLTKPKPRPLEFPRRYYDLVIIGGGPAGLTAGLYAARSRSKTLLIERALPGGQISLTETVENYPGCPNVKGIELGQRMEAQARAYGLETAWGNVTTVELRDERKLITTELGTYEARAVIIATGAKSKKLGVKGEEEFRGKGVCYSAMADGEFYTDKKVAVVGGGNTALTEALYLTRFISNLAVIHRRSKLRADDVLESRARENSKIYFLWNHVVTEIQGDGKVEGLVLKDVTTDKPNHLPMDGIFIYIGTIPSTQFLKGIVPLDEEGYIIVKSDLSTDLPGVFAAGEARKGSYREIVTVAGDGAIAALSALQYLGER